MKKIYLLVVMFSLNISLAQTTTNTPSDFWKKVRFGGGFGVNFGNNATDINLSPIMMYQVNEKFSVGTGLLGSYVDVINNFNSLIYGASIIGFYNVIPEIQLSSEFEQLRVNTKFNNSNIKDSNYWSSAVFLGAGYTTNNMTFGVRYNILHNNKSIYSEAWMPFFRVLF
jgi:long-subunit fatty acid transport protein